MTTVWLGAIMAPAGTFALLPLWPVIEVKCAHFSPSTMTLDEPCLKWTVFMFTFETMPPSVPASSPLERGISLLVVQTFLFSILTFCEQDPPEASETLPKFGKGVGTGGVPGT